MSFFRRRMMADVKYNVTFNLDGLTTSANTKVSPGSSYTASFTPDTGKQLIPASVKVTMGGTDITEDVYDFETNQIKISSVTSTISVTAKAITVSSEYTLLPYIYYISRGAYPGIDLGFKATEKTKIFADFLMTGGTREYVLPEYNVSRTGTHYFGYWIYSSKSYFGWGGSSTNFTPAIPWNVRANVTIDKGLLTFNYEGDNTTYSKDLSSDITFTGTGNLCIFGNRRTSYSGGTLGKIYRYKHWEDDVLQRDFVPAVNSSGVTGMLNILDETIFRTPPYLADNNVVVEPSIILSRTLTNCTASKTIDRTGSATIAVIGKTWICNFVPSSGYTFNSDDAVFQVTINNEDVTSDVAVYNSTTDSYTVTLVAHWNDTINVTATAQEKCYDAEVEYLQSDGNQYIDSGIECTGDLKVHFEGLVTSTVNASACGGIHATSPYFRHHWSPYTSSNFYWIQKSTSNSSSIQYGNSKDTYYEVVVDPINGTGSVNGTAKTFTALQASYTTGQNYFIFARKASDGAMQSRPSRFTFFKMWRNGTLLRDFIPVRKDGVGYFYDKVSKTLFGNASSEGAFTYGADKNASLSLSNPNTINNTNPDNEEEEEM